MFCKGLNHCDPKGEQKKKYPQQTKSEASLDQYVFLPHKFTSTVNATSAGEDCLQEARFNLFQMISVSILANSFLFSFALCVRIFFSSLGEILEKTSPCNTAHKEHCGRLSFQNETELSDRVIPQTSHYVRQRA